MFPNLDVFYQIKGFLGKKTVWTFLFGDQVYLYTPFSGLGINNTENTKQEDICPWIFPWIYLPWWKSFLAFEKHAPRCKKNRNVSWLIWLVVSTPLKNRSQIGSNWIISPQGSGWTSKIFELPPPSWVLLIYNILVLLFVFPFPSFSIFKTYPNFCVLLHQGKTPYRTLELWSDFFNVAPITLVFQSYLVRIGVCTPKHLLRMPLGGPTTYSHSQGIWRILED